MADANGLPLADLPESLGLPRGESLPDGTSLEVVPRLIELVTSAKTPSLVIAGTGSVRFNDSNISELVGAILSNNNSVETLSLKYHHIGDEGMMDITRLVQVLLHLCSLVEILTYNITISE